MFTKGLRSAEHAHSHRQTENLRGLSEDRCTAALIGHHLLHAVEPTNIRKKNSAQAVPASVRTRAGDPISMTCACAELCYSMLILIDMTELLRLSEQDNMLCLLRQL